MSADREGPLERTEYRTVRRRGSAEVVRKKSRFLAVAAPAADEMAALALVNERREGVSNAGHHVFAYRLGLGVPELRFSDDGEPSGTAGMPLLKVLEGEDLRQIVVVVSRIFGGTLLGTGGLARAYSDAGRAALKASDLVQVVRHVILSFEIPYSLWGEVEHSLHRLRYDITKVDFGAEVQLTIELPWDEEERFCSWLRDLSADQAEVCRQGSLFRTRNQ